MSTTEETNNSADEKDYELSLFETLLTYIRHWRWFLLSIALMMVMGYGYIKLITPVYKIETDLLIKDQKGNKGGENDLLKSLNLFTSEKIIDNEIQILKSHTIVKKVVLGLNLQTSYFATQGVRKAEFYNTTPFEVELLKPAAPGDESRQPLNIRLINNNQAEVNGKSCPLSTPIKTALGEIMVIKRPNWMGRYFSQLISVKFNNLDGLVEAYSTKLKIDPASKQSSVLIITMEDAVPQRGMDFLNRLVNEYNQAAVEDKNKVTATTLDFIDQELRRIANELGSTEKDVEQYKSKNKITDISSESQMFLQGVQDNDMALNKINIQLSVLQNLQDYLHNNEESQSSKLPSMLGVDDPTLLGLVSRLGESQLRRQSLLETVPETNPLVISFTDQIAGLKQAIDASVQNLKKGLDITKQQLDAKSKHFENIIEKVPSKERGLIDVMRQQEIKNGLFTFLLQKREETAMSLAGGVADSRTIDAANSSREPIKPVRKVIYIVFFMLGLVIPIAVIYFKGLLNYKVTRRLDIERATRTPILAEISHSADAKALLVVDKPRAMVTEQIRALRTNLQFILPDDEQKVILFTSTISGEGKSFVSLNLGASLVMAGKRVVILELDLRKPKLHAGLGIDNNLGLSNYLIGKATFEQVLKEIDVQKNYFIIPSGPIPPNPAEILANGKIAVLLERLKQEFDYIILDAPPIGLVTDAQILAPYSDATMFIVRHNYTSKSHIGSIEDYYTQKKFPNLNIILNSIDLQLGYGYSNYSYGYNSYGSGYGNGYYQDDKVSKRNWLKNLFKIK